MYIIHDMDQRHNDDASSLEALRRQLLGEQGLSGAAYDQQAAGDVRQTGASAGPSFQHPHPERQVVSGFPGRGADLGPAAFDNQAAGSMSSELIRQVAGLSGTGTPPLDSRNVTSHNALQSLLFGSRPHEPAPGDTAWNSRTLQDLAASMMNPSGQMGGHVGSGPALSHGMFLDNAQQPGREASAGQLGDPSSWGFGMPGFGAFDAQGAGMAGLDRYGGVQQPFGGMESLRGFEAALSTGANAMPPQAARGMQPMPDMPFSAYAQTQQPAMAPPQAQHQQTVPPTRGMHSIASPAAAAGPPAPSSGGGSVLAAKVLTESDVKHSRAILPRIAIENNLPFIVGFRTFGLILPDQDGFDWEFVIKSWANGRSEKSGQTRRKDRRVYVVEQLAPFLAKHGLGVGNIIGIVVVDGALTVCVALPQCFITA